MIDVRSQIATAVGVPHTGSNTYAATDANSFLCDIGRANAILHTDDESPIQAVARELTIHVIGLTMIVTHTGPKESPGSI